MIIGAPGSLLLRAAEVGMTNRHGDEEVDWGVQALVQRPSYAE